MRVSLQPAYVLHSRPYRDSSLILELLTPEHGRLSLVARGGRGAGRKGRRGAVLQPFVPLLISFSGRSELKNLTASESAGAARLLRGERLFSGFYLNELLVRLLHRHDPHPELFAAYAHTLDALSDSQPVDVALREFEFRLLHQLGYGFPLDVDALSGEPVQPGAWYVFDPDHGLVLRPGAADPSRPAYSGADLLAMAAGEFGGAARRGARNLSREALARHLGGAPLRSRELFRSRGGAAAGSGG